MEGETGGGWKARREDNGGGREETGGGKEAYAPLFRGSLLHFTAFPLHDPECGRAEFIGRNALSSVVGYTAPTLTKSLQNSGVCFVTVEGGDVDIQSIKPTSNGAEASDGSFAIRWFNAGKYDRAIWCAPLYADEEGETELGYNGWGDENYLMPITKSFAAGQWFLVQPNSATVNPSLTVAGALVTSDTTKPTYTVSLQKTLQSTGNPFPTTCNIQSIVPLSNDKEASDGAFAIRWFNAGKYDRAVWCAPLYADEEGETELDYNGWGDENYLMPIEKTFGVSEGFLVQPNSATVNPKLAFPNPLYSSGN